MDEAPIVQEVDNVVKKRRSIAAIEVKSGRDSASHSGMAAFTKSFRPKQVLLVVTGGIPPSQFPGTPIAPSITI
jgi:hypothetical protein